uniref:Uncharacterized protein n=1 Tax=Mycena chlorophos TaxID=658473 RepID=A0ABQ0L6J5_MYCCL|nr:predicted protein [Mycena chlorophos]
MSSSSGPHDIPSLIRTMFDWESLSSHALGAISVTTTTPEPTPCRVPPCIDILGAQAPPPTAARYESLPDHLRLRLRYTNVRHLLADDEADSWCVWVAFSQMVLIAALRLDRQRALFQGLDSATLALHMLSLSDAIHLLMHTAISTTHDTLLYRIHTNTGDLHLFAALRPETRSVVRTLRAFATRFADMTDNVFGGLDWSNTAAVGSIVLSCVVDGRVGGPSWAEGWTMDTAVELVIHGLDASGAVKKLQHICACYAANTTGATIYWQSLHCVSLLSDGGPRVEVSLALPESIDRYLLDETTDAHAMCWDGSRVRLTPVAVRSLEGPRSLHLRECAHYFPVSANRFTTGLVRDSRRNFATEYLNFSIFAPAIQGFSLRISEPQLNQMGLSAAPTCARANRLKRRTATVAVESALRDHDTATFPLNGLIEWEDGTNDRLPTAFLNSGWQMYRYSHLITWALANEVELTGSFRHVDGLMQHRLWREAGTLPVDPVKVGDLWKNHELRWLLLVESGFATGWFVFNDRLTPQLRVGQAFVDMAMSEPFVLPLIIPSTLYDSISTFLSLTYHVPQVPPFLLHTIGAVGPYSAPEDRPFPLFVKWEISSIYWRQRDVRVDRIWHVLLAFRGLLNEVGNWTDSDAAEFLQKRASATQERLILTLV